MSLQVNSGKINKVYSLSYTEPYFTKDGVSLGYDIYRRDVDTANLNSVIAYSTSTIGAGVRLGIPLSEFDTLNLGTSIEQYSLKLNPDPTVTPQQMTSFSHEHGGDDSGVKTRSLRLTTSWARDSRDSFFYPTKGAFQQFSAEMGTPIGDLQYYKVAYQHQWLRPVFNNMTLMLNGEIGWGGGFKGQSLPFFQNYYAGGIGSVRGFDSGTLGPKVLSNGSSVAIGGDRRLVGNAELLFPFPGAENDHSLRLSVFADTGAVWGPNDVNGQYSKVSLADLRYSAGLAVTWISPMGPIKLSLAKALKSMSDDKTQMFQFQLGQVF
jgi:outer membrane protein insertion porin family